MPSEDLLVDLPPEAQASGQVTDPPGRYGVAAGVWDGTEVPFWEMNGTRQRQTYRIPNAPGALADMMAALSRGLTEAGFEIVLSCIDLTCGGFDFRHRLEVLPLPGMYVDLGRFRYVSGARVRDGEGEDGQDTTLVSLLASASGALVYLQVDLITPLTETEEAEAVVRQALPAVPLGALADGADPSETAQQQIEPVPEAPAQPQDPAEAFAASGEMVLEDVSFAFGSADLAAGTYPSLAYLAAYLAATPDVRIVLVGHTDSTGTLDGNIVVSRRRAQAVADRLVAQYGVSRARLDVEGAGYLAPRADNRTEAGRAQNRRVTAVLLAP